jgi:DDE_Tnp_1-associated
MCMRVPSSLQDHCASLTDPRSSHALHQRHELLAILVMAVCAVIGGADGWEDIEEYGKAQAAWCAEGLD